MSGNVIRIKHLAHRAKALRRFAAGAGFPVARGRGASDATVIRDQIPRGVDELKNVITGWPGRSWGNHSVAAARRIKPA